MMLYTVDRKICANFLQSWRILFYKHGLFKDNALFLLLLLAQDYNQTFCRFTASFTKWVLGPEDFFVAFLLLCHARGLCAIVLFGLPATYDAEVSIPKSSSWYITGSVLNVETFLLLRSKHDLFARGYELGPVKIIFQRWKSIGRACPYRAMTAIAFLSFTCLKKMNGSSDWRSFQFFFASLQWRNAIQRHATFDLWSFWL